MSSRPLVAVLIGLCLLGLDFTSKLAARILLEPGVPHAIVPGLNITLVHNPGISFGLMPASTDLGYGILLLFHAALTAGVAIYAWSQRDSLEFWPLLLVLFGGLGNLMDRLLHGTVTDFLDAYIGAYHWPAFNLADVSITLGAAGVIAFGTGLVGKVRSTIKGVVL